MSQPNTEAPPVQAPPVPETTSHATSGSPVPAPPASEAPPAPPQLLSLGARIEAARSAWSGRHTSADVVNLQRQVEKLTQDLAAAQTKLAAVTADRDAQAVEIGEAHAKVADFERSLVNACAEIGVPMESLPKVTSQPSSESAPPPNLKGLQLAAWRMEQRIGNK